MKRLLIATALLLASIVPASAQLTVMPIPLAQWFDNSGNVLSAGGMCVYRAGTTTLASTYTTAAGAVANDNPILFNSAGRATTGGVFLVPGQSYKFALIDFTSVVTPSCSPINGTTLWTVDNVEAVPGSSASVDVTGTAGETITAGQLAYMSDGSGSKNPGQWYLADADLTYAGALPLLGIAPNTVNSGGSGSFRIQGAVDGLSALTPGSDYYVSGTPGAMTVTPPAFARLVGRAESATVMIVAPNPRTTPISPRVPCGRLTLTTGVPVTTTDVTAATTLYYTPYGGCNSISTYNGSVWVQQTFTEISIAVPATTAQMYDVFAYDSAGTLTLELTAWTNDTTRATALTTQNGIYVKTGALTRLYLGSFRTTAVSGQTADAAAFRLLWNYYNRVDRFLSILEATDSWTYTTATWRQARGSTANQVAVVVGVAEDAIELTLMAHVQNDGAGRSLHSAIGEDSTTTPLGIGQGGTISYINSPVGTYIVVSPANVRRIPAAGYHFYAWLEQSQAAGTTTWYGDIGSPTLMQSGMVGKFKS